MYVAWGVCELDDLLLHALPGSMKYVYAGLVRAVMCVFDLQLAWGPCKLLQWICQGFGKGCLVGNPRLHFERQVRLITI